MSASPFFYIEHFNQKTNQWEKFDIFAKNEKGELKPVDLWWWNGSHELFSVLELEHSYDNPRFSRIHFGLPSNISEEVKSIYDSHCYETGVGTISEPQVTWFNMADGLLYLEHNPTVLDYDEMDEYWEENKDDSGEVPKIYKDNPLKGLIDRVENFTSIGLDAWDYFPSDIRVIGWLLW